MGKRHGSALVFLRQGCDVLVVSKKDPEST